MINTSTAELDLNKIQKYKIYLLNLSLDKLKKLIDKYSKPQKEGYDRIRQLKLNVIDKLNGEQIEALVQIAKARFDIIIQIDRDLVLGIINKIKDLEILIKCRTAHCPAGYDYDIKNDRCVPKVPSWKGISSTGELV